MPNGQTAPATADHNGTSASAPFVAGIAAMLKAFDPSLTSDQVRDLLRDHAWTDSADPDVDRYVDAHRSLAAVAPGVDIAPLISVSLPGRTTLDVDLNRGFQVLATTSDVEDGTPCCQVTWTPAPVVSNAGGRSAVLDLHSTGTQTITAVATDSGGATAQATLEVTVHNQAPVVGIEEPLDGHLVLSGANLQLRGTATDANEGPGPDPGALPCGALHWSSDDPGDVGLPATGCDLTVQFSTPGNRVVTLEAHDPEGLVGSTQVNLVVGAPPTNYPPTIHVGSLPAFTYNGDGYPMTNALSFTASATDPEGNTPIQFRWSATTFRPGQDSSVYVGAAPVGAATTATGNLDWTPSSTPDLFIPDCTGANAYLGQKVELTVLASDSLGYSSSVTLPAFRVYKCTLN